MFVDFKIFLFYRIRRYSDRNPEGTADPFRPSRCKWVEFKY